MTLLAFGAGLIATQRSADDPAPLIVHGPEAVAREIAAADKAFSARSATAGTATAFRDFMDGKDGLEFAGGEPERGSKEIYDAHGGDHPFKSVLTWEPAEIFASAGGNLGVSWGHRLSKPNDPAEKPITGHYVTVWRKNPAGEWKGVVDIGDADGAS
ncbi:MAG: hypothetical protein JWM91_4655 [Rhodospirillales bacterium]|nr:hypothetical protein [Rhodospirillales bacterium]